MSVCKKHKYYFHIKLNAKLGYNDKQNVCHYTLAYSLSLAAKRKSVVPLSFTKEYLPNITGVNMYNYNHVLEKTEKYIRPANSCIFNCLKLAVKAVMEQLKCISGG